jgi:hypothetical protein
VTQEFATQKQTSAKDQSREILVQAICNATMVWRAERAGIGHSLQSVCQWQMLDLRAKQTTIASQGISVGNWELTRTDSALKNTLPLIKLSSYGILASTLRSTLNLSMLTVSFASRDLLLESQTMLLNALQLMKLGDLFPFSMSLTMSTMTASLQQESSMTK